MQITCTLLTPWKLTLIQNGNQVSIWAYLRGNIIFLSWLWAQSRSWFELLQTLNGLDHTYLKESFCLSVCFEIIQGGPVVCASIAWSSMVTTWARTILVVVPHLWNVCLEVHHSLYFLQNGGDDGNLRVFVLLPLWIWSHFYCWIHIALWLRFAFWVRFCYLLYGLTLSHFKGFGQEYKVHTQGNIYIRFLKIHQWVRQVPHCTYVWVVGSVNKQNKLDASTKSLSTAQENLLVDIMTCAEIFDILWWLPATPILPEKVAYSSSNSS